MPPDDIRTASPDSAGGTWPMVTRGRQLESLRAALEAHPTRLQLIDGAAGTGKSALVAAAARRMPDREAIVVIATDERTRTPLGAFDDVLRGIGATEDSVSAVVAELGREPDRRVLVVDDAPRLDDASAEVVRRVVRSYGMPVLATARTGERLPGPLRRLDAEGLVRRHRLDGLSTHEVARLVEERFRVPARDEDVRRLVWETDGNPLHLRILVDSAIEAGDVLHRGNVVELRVTGEHAALEATLTARVASLSPGARHLLAVIAVTQPVHRAHLAGVPGHDDALAELQRRGMTIAESGTSRLRVAHPLIAETLGDADDPAAVHEEALRILRATGEPSHRFSAIALEERAGREPAPGELVWAAGYASARGDHRGAARLADAALRRPAARAVALAAHLAAATQHSLSGGLDEADRLFAHAEPLIRDPAERAALASARGEHLAHRRHDADGAIAQALRARAGLTDQEAVALDADIWRWRMSADGTGMDGPASRIRGAIAAVVAAAMRGEPAAAREEAATLAAVSGEPGPLAPAVSIALGLQRTIALRATGGAEGAASYLESARASAGDEVGFFTLMLATQRMQEGHLAEALRLAELTVEQLRRWDGGELLALGLALRATVHAQRGELDAARNRLAELDGMEVSGAAVLQRAECRAFLAAAEGDRPRAANGILDVVADAVASGYRFLGALTLASALRLGETRRTAALAEQLCAGMAEQSEPCLAIRDLAVALERRQPDRVVAAARRLGRAGLVPAAIDAIALALDLPAKDETRRRLRALSSTLSAGTDAPPLQRRGSPGLTPRELEVARAAATRLRAREIAERVGVSARTVENQLYSVYRKLGIASRDELRDALADAGLLAVDD